METYDCVIIGAGPAGLLLAKDLSKEHSVLVLEKNKIGETNKNWLTYKDRWANEGFPKTFITNEFKQWHVMMKYGVSTNQYIINDQFLCFDEHRLLSWLAKKCVKQGCNIKFSTPFNSFSRKKNQLVINGKFSTNLLVDCSGIDSLIVKKYSLVELPIYINCFAYTAEFDNVQNNNFYCFYRNKNSNHYSAFGLTNIAPKHAQLQYFKYSNNKPQLKRYRQEMLQAQKNFKIPKHKIIELKTASYPTGVLKKRELDNIVLFGDAGFYSPSLNGMGFNEILRQHKRVANHLSKCIKNNLYSEKDLKLPKDIADDVNNLVFRFLGLIINNLPPRILDEIFTLISRLSKSDIRRIMRNDITDNEAIRIFRLLLGHVNLNLLVKAVKKHHTRYIIKTLFELDKDILTEEIHNLVFRHHKIRIKDMYR